jgi:hypothetical protein
MQGNFKSPLPRYNPLTLCVRMALYGPSAVRHMVERNRALDEYAAMERLAKQEGLA